MVRVASCLYRYQNTGYYAVIKRSGKQVKRSLNTSDRKLAERRLRELQADLDSLDLDQSHQTLDGFAPVWISSLSGATATIYKHRLAMETLLGSWPSDAPRKFKDIKSLHCETWVATSRLDLTATTRRDRIMSAKAMFAAATKAGIIARSPFADVDLPKRAKVIRLTPSEGEFRAIVADLRGQKFNGHGRTDTADFVELAGVLGLGQAELASIERQHIDLAEDIIQIRRKKTGQIFEVPIFHDAQEIIRRRLATMPLDPDAELFPQYNCRIGLKGACQRLNLPAFTARSLRRYHITRCIKAGVAVPTIASWQGHQDGGELILKVYADVLGRKHSKAQAALLAPPPQHGKVVQLNQETA